MTHPPVAIVAVADNGVIGRGNALPWRLPDDLRRFRALTLGHTVLMGRRTFESLPHALPGRRNLVLTRDTRWHAPGCVAVPDIAAALGEIGESGRLFVSGGAQVFLACWPLVLRIELTEVHASVAGDTRLAGFERSAWHEICREDHGPDARHAHAYSFVTLARR